MHKRNSVVSSVEEIPIPHYGIAVILLKDVFGEIPMPSTWYWSDPPLRYLRRYTNAIIMVLLWSSSKTSLEISQCHHHGIAVTLLNDFLVKKQDWFVTNYASWLRNPWRRSQQYHNDIIGISLKDIFEEDHSNTMVWHWDLSIWHLESCHQVSYTLTGWMASGILSSGQLHFNWVDQTFANSKKTSMFIVLFMFRFIFG